MPDRIELSDLFFTYGSAPLMRGVSLSMRRGEIVLIGGRSGHGTSTLLELSVGLVAPQQGSVRWDGTDLAALSYEQLLSVRKSIGYVFQNDALISSFTVFDNVALPIRGRRNMSDAALRRCVREELETVMLFNLDSRFPETLSAGQGKLAAIARALISDPAFLFLDKPVSDVDSDTARGILSILEERWRRLGMGIVMITNDLSLWRDLPVRRYVLDSGRLYSHELPEADRRLVLPEER